LSKEDYEKSVFLKYVLNNHREQIKLAKEENKPTKINIDYPLLNEYFKKETGKEFLKKGYEVYMNHVESRLNNNATQKNYISLKLVEVPPNVMLHDLDTTYNGELVSCKAMIKTITEPIPALKQAAFICQGCGRMHYIDSESSQIAMPGLCPKCGGRNFRMVDESSTFHNVRYVKLEEPLELRSGGSSREFKGYMEDYLASPQHNIKAGDVCDILGTFNVERISPNKNDFEFIFKLHNIAPVDDAFEDYRITESDKEKIKELSQSEGIYQKLVDTLMPEIYGYKTVKEGLLLQLFEGNRPSDDSFKTDTMDRWTIHVLLIGDPGIGKSQIIGAMDKRAPKIMSIAGTSTSQAGLTTSAVKDELTGTWTLEAGAVVLADTGLLCVDEYDKLSATAQKSLNEPMEQLSVSSAKAGLVQKMTARTSVLACANPKYSRFNKYKTIKEQIDIPESNLSRFDLVFALEDKIDKEKDRILATNLLNKENFVNDVDVIDLELFKKYITYAKMECFPVLDSQAQNLLVDFYGNTRQAALQNSDGKPITPRDLKALERLTIARAKTELREVATVSDAKAAIRIYNEGLASVGLTPETAGELEHVWSDNEIELVEEAENMIKLLIDRDEMFYEDIIEDVRHEIGVRCTELKCDLDDIMDEAKRNVEKGF